MNTVPDAFEVRGGGHRSETEFILYVGDILDGADAAISRN